mgnify:CR=1 FL=1
MDLKARLESHNLQTLRDEVGKQQDILRGYSKLKKRELITLMLKHEKKFNYIQMKQKEERAEKGGRSKKFDFRASDSALRNTARSLMEYIKNGYIIKKSDFKNQKEIDEFVKYATEYYKGGGNGIVEKALSMYKPKNRNYKFEKIKVEKRKIPTQRQQKKKEAKSKFSLLEF